MPLGTDWKYWKCLLGIEHYNCWAKNNHVAIVLSRELYVADSSGWISKRFDFSVDTLG